MNIYIAGKYENKMMIQTLKFLLGCCFCKINFICNWAYETSFASTWKERADRDYGSIDQCNLLIATYPFGQGTSSEMGYALGKKIPVIFYVDKLIHSKYEMPLPMGRLLEENIVHTVNELLTRIGFYYRSQGGSNVNR